MRKTVAFILGVALVFGLGLAFLPPSLQLIGLWLTPLLGTQFYVALSLAYLLLADPLMYPAVLFVWLAVAFIGGVIVRRRLGGVLTMLLVWLLVVPMLALSVFGVAMNVQHMMEDVEDEEALGLVPPIPEGLTLTQLLETPMLGDVFMDVLTMIGEGAEQEIGMDFIMGYAYRALSWMALKPLIVLVGALIGVEAGRIGQRFMPESLSGSLQADKPGSIAALKTLIVVFILLGATATPAEGQFIDLGEGVYVEQLVAGTDGEGHVGLINVFLETEDAEVPDNVVAAIVVSQEIQAASLLSLLPFPEELDTESFLNLAPDTMYAVVYGDTPPEEAMQSSAQVKALLEDRVGVELVTLHAFELPEFQLDEATLPSMTAVVGYSDADAAEVAEAFLNGVMEHGGLAEGVDEAVSNGALAPGAREGSADGSVFMSGFIRLEPFTFMLPEDPMLDMFMEDLEVLFEEPIGFAVSGHYWDEGAATEGLGQSVDLTELLGLESLPGYSLESDASFITMLTPNQTSAGDELGVAIRFFSNLPQTSPLLPMYGFMAGGFGNVTYMEGTSVTADALRMTLDRPLPPRLIVSKTASRVRAATGSQVEVTVSVTNRGNNAVQDVEIDDGSTLLGYEYASDLRGSDTKIIASLAPGATETLTYGVTLNRPGVFRLRPAKVSYVSGGETYGEVSDRPTVETGPPGLVQAGFTLRGDLVRLIDLAADGRGDTVVTVVTLVVGALVLLNLALSVRRWRLGVAPLEPVEIDEP
jgi:hypothetical protein